MLELFKRGMFCNVLGSPRFSRDCLMASRHGARRYTLNIAYRRGHGKSRGLELFKHGTFSMGLGSRAIGKSSGIIQTNK